MNLQNPISSLTPLEGCTVDLHHNLHQDFSTALAIFFTIIKMGTLFDMARVTLFGAKNNATRKGTQKFNPARDIPSLARKIILITGGASGMGRQTAVELARCGKPARIYVADLPRSKESGLEVAQQITQEAFGASQSKPPTEIRYLDLDLGSFEGTRKCAAEFVAQEQQLDILILNAGVLNHVPRLTAEGYEFHFGINYLGHALLSKLLAPILLHTTEKQERADVRVVILSSEGHISAPPNGVDFEAVKTDCRNMSWFRRYGQSKIATIGLAKEFAGQYPQIRTVAIHPGRVSTGIATSVEQKYGFIFRLIRPLQDAISVPVTVGINNHLWAATNPNAISGTYYDPVGIPGRMSSRAKDDKFVRRLREWTDNELSGVKPIA
ncbi:oxidoreductase [Paramyrothecium foliicola]|nr:oxidoreductase [Paramyrothecium foliicola]